MQALKMVDGARVPSISELVERIDTASKIILWNKKDLKVQINAIEWNRKASVQIGCTSKLILEKVDPAKYEKSGCDRVWSREGGLPVFYGKVSSKLKILW